MIKKCKVFPNLKDIKNNDSFEIIDKNVTDYTHVIHKYPSKYIPQIPRWAILNFTKEGDFILDPFSGSGTTSVEACLNKRKALAIDINPLAVLISKVKSTFIDPNLLEIKYKKLILETKLSDKYNEDVIPNIPNINHWFIEKSIIDLAKLKTQILKIENKDIKDFFLVTFSAIIRKTSNAEYRSQKTYVSSRFKKEPSNVFDIFEKRFFQYLAGMKKAYEENNKMPDREIFVGSADDFKKDDFKSLDKKVKLAVTSPPYITAVEYPSVFKLEYQWLDYFEDSEINEHRKNYIGTDRVYKAQYENLMITGYEDLDITLKKIYSENKKKSFIVYEYFYRMEKNIECVYKMLEDGGKYVIVVGNNSVMNLEISICKFLIEIAEKKGFYLAKVFNYIIKDRHLVFPRKGRGGIINKDWVIVLEKR